MDRQAGNGKRNSFKKGGYHIWRQSFSLICHLRFCGLRITPLEPLAHFCFSSRLTNGRDGRSFPSPCDPWYLCFLHLQSQLLAGDISWLGGGFNFSPLFFSAWQSPPTPQKKTHQSPSQSKFQSILEISWLLLKTASGGHFGHFKSGLPLTQTDQERKLTTPQTLGKYVTCKRVLHYLPDYLLISTKLIFFSRLWNSPINCK